MKRNFNDWLAQFRSSIANYEYYTDFNKVFENVDVIKVSSINSIYPLVSDSRTL